MSQGGSSANFSTLLVNGCFGALALIVSAVTPSIENLNYYITLFITPMFLFSGIFFPVESLPAWAQIVAWFTPLMHGVRLIRGLVLGLPGHLWADALWLVAVFILVVPWPVLLMRRKLIK